jgi:hypothetical protein
VGASAGQEGIITVYMTVRESVERTKALATHERAMLIGQNAERALEFQTRAVREFGAEAGIFLRQLVFWSGRGVDASGCIYKSRDEWQEETGLSRRQQDKARRILRDRSVIEETRGGRDNRNWYRPVASRIMEIFEVSDHTQERRRDSVRYDTAVGFACGEEGYDPGEPAPPYADTEAPEPELVEADPTDEELAESQAASGTETVPEGKSGWITKAIPPAGSPRWADRLAHQGDPTLRARENVTREQAEEFPLQGLCESPESSTTTAVVENASSSSPRGGAAPHHTGEPKEDKEQEGKDNLTLAAGRTLTTKAASEGIGDPRPRDLRRRQLTKLEAAGTVALDGDAIMLAANWREALHRERELRGELDSDRADRRRYEQEREAFHGGGETM